MDYVSGFRQGIWIYHILLDILYIFPSFVASKWKGKRWLYTLDQTIQRERNKLS